MSDDTGPTEVLSSQDSTADQATTRNEHARSISGAGTASAPGTSPVDAMFVEEVERTRAFLRIGDAIGLAILASLLVVGGDPMLKPVLAGLAVVTVAVMIWLDLHIRDPRNFTNTKMLVVALLITAAVVVGVLFWGQFSPAPAMFVLGIFFYSRSQNLPGAALVFGIIAASQAVIPTALLLGWVDDPGMFTRDPHQPWIEPAITAVMIEVTMLAAFLLGRTSRASTLQAIQRLQSAMRQVSQRDALLQEARHDLARALRPGGAGRYTEQTLGSYRLGVVIGRGAMGEVYEAQHVDTGEAAAVKVLHPHVVQDPNHVARFLREAQVASALDSPHVVRVLEASDGFDPILFLAMERLTGNDLSHHLRARRRLTPSRIVALVRQIGSALDEARDKGIVHRDLKPQNLFLARQPDGSQIWKVLDFGVSKLAEHSGTLTRGHVVGTPVYMAPEQARSSEVDHRTDLYALAAVAYRCATGRPPFGGKDVPTVLYSVVHTTPLRPSECASLPVEVDAVLAIGLAKRARDRFDRGADLADALDAAVTGRLDDRLRQRAAALQAEHPWRSNEGEFPAEGPL